ncbi:uncharacterized protein BXZ73DRAFT_95418 [Epithele typhae]|uniref:uncharacterized protein n=1 Tax=Epithele typhae TaxID=378194 RepID=UPI0020078C38|nr:uncharacterized protein BXZ73DRAFT_95418 [Epithele typhae]KAH9945901.1 hypothetical protein BXZ73DRAFT_95418 [Epithele typhae]
MKILATISALVASSVAQSVLIRSPAPNETVSPNQTFVVEVDKPNSLSPSMDISVAIGMESCNAAGCEAVSQAQMLGNVLFAGGFDPVLKPGTGDLFQNFTVQVPATMPSGQAMLTVAHFYLLGAGANPAVELANVTLNLQNVQ